MTDEWRPWRLVWYATKTRPPAEPPPKAERSADDAWATVYDLDGHTVLAVWMRYRLPTRETRAGQTAKRRETRRPPTEEVV